MLTTQGSRGAMAGPRKPCPSSPLVPISASKPLLPTIIVHPLNWWRDTQKDVPTHTLINKWVQGVGKKSLLPTDPLETEDHTVAPCPALSHPPSWSEKWSPFIPNRRTHQSWFIREGGPEGDCFVQFSLGKWAFLIFICSAGTSENTGKQSFQVLFRRQLCHCLTQNSQVESYGSRHRACFQKPLTKQLRKVPDTP